MTTLEVIEQDLKTAYATKLVIQIARDQLHGMELDDIIDKYVFKVKAGLEAGWFNTETLKEN